MSKKNEETQEVTEEETIKVSELINESLEKSTKEAAEFKDKYFRTLAESENMRKRLQQESQEKASYAVANLIKDMLTPLDSFENALSFTDNLSDEMQNWAQGFKMIAAQFKQVLEENGVIPFESVGRPFDPHFHEALENVETSSHPEGVVIDEICKGYMRGNTVLRAAKVKVAKKPDTSQNSLEKENNDE